jgi:hypothetical protein
MAFTVLPFRVSSCSTRMMGGACLQASRAHRSACRHAPPIILVLQEDTLNGKTSNAIGEATARKAPLSSTRLEMSGLFDSATGW